MYKNNLKKQEDWKENFTLVTDKWTYGADPTKRPYWLCKDPTGKCQGHGRWPSSFPAIRRYKVKLKEPYRTSAGMKTHEIELEWDENAPPMTFVGWDDDLCPVHEIMTECPDCRRYRDGSTEE